MTQKAIVTFKDNSEIQVSPMLKEACASCSAGCAKQRKVFSVSNPHNYSINIGSVVLLTASKKMQAFQGIVSLLFPVLCAIAGNFIAYFLAIKLEIQSKDSLQAIFVLLFLFISASLVVLVTRKHSLPGIPEISEVLN